MNGKLGMSAIAGSRAEQGVLLRRRAVGLGRLVMRRAVVYMLRQCGEGVLWLGGW